MRIIAYFDMDGEIATKRLIEDNDGYKIQRVMLGPDSVDWVTIIPSKTERPYMYLEKLMAIIKAAARLFDERKSQETADDDNDDRIGT